MKNIAAIKRNNRKIHARKFLSTPEGKAWLDWPPESPDNQYHLNK
ncbi:hypothetical protein AB9B23_21405 [Escherichia coli]